MSSHVGRTLLGGGGPFRVAFEAERATPLEGARGCFGGEDVVRAVRPLVSREDCVAVAEGADDTDCLPDLTDGAGDFVIEDLSGEERVGSSSSRSITSTPSLTSPPAGFANVGGGTALDAM